MAKKYLLGLDLGTNSVGWCVTDENNKIVKKQGKALWGARLFDEAHDASGRRANRAARRRLTRRKERVDLLRAIFKQEIDKIDSSFFFRLDESAFYKEDKHPSLQGYKYLLFNEPNFNDKTFYQKYPTIYHLRQALVNSKEKADIRLIYLAFAHMVKYRGNFLNEGQTIQAFDPEEAEVLFAELNEELLEKDGRGIKFSKGCVELLKGAIAKSRGISGRKEALSSVLPTDSAFAKNVVYPLIAGGQVGIKKIFGDEIDDDFEPKNIDCSSASFEEDLLNLDETFSGAVEVRIIRTSKKLYDFVLLGRLLGDNQTVSDMIVQRYNEHKVQLRDFKKYIKGLGADAYKSMFGEVLVVKDKRGLVKEGNYSAYVGQYFNGRKVQNCIHCSRDSFYAYVKKMVGLKNKNGDQENCIDPYLTEISNAMSNGSFLPRQNSTDNGVLPYQLNLQEMEMIMDNQSLHYPFLAGIIKDSEGYSDRDKIISLLTFRRPYYVGPVVRDGKNSPFAWTVTSKDAGNIYPWNFEKNVDMQTSAQKFIQRMLNRCTYFPEENCLPKGSLLYQEYEVYSFLNNIKMNGSPLTIEQKDKLIEDVFKKQGRVKAKDLENAFKPNDAKFAYSQSQTPLTDKDIPSLSSYCFFAKDTILGKEFVESNEGREIVEKIILDLTVFNERSIVAERLTKLYSLPIKEENKKQVINSIKNKPMAGWGKFSKKLLLLETPYMATEYGEVVQKTLIQLLKETNLSFMKLINDDEFDFKRQIDEAAEMSFEEYGDRKAKHKAIVDYVDDAYVSPGMKRPLIQAMNIIEDVEKILHHRIDEYYVECTRSNKAEKKKKSSRKEQLESLYEDAIKLAKKNKDEKMSGELKTAQELLVSMEESKLRSDKYFLYFLQWGRDAYSFKPIELDNIDGYDIDHIIPQALVKDDSLSNRVLVACEENRAKGAIYPIKDEVFKDCGRSKIKSFYKQLKQAGFMSDKKYASLTRTAPLTEDDLQSFVNRQLVYTSQSVKALIDLIARFQKKEDGSTPLVVYSKAENVSDFRHRFDILKSRDANDCHHAHDAYLNICVGRAFHRYFELNYWKHKNESVSELIANIETGKESLNFDNVFDPRIDKDGVIHRKPLLDNDGSVVWDYTKSVGSIKKNVYEHHYMFMTRMQCTSGDFFSKIQLAPKGKGNVPAKLKLLECVNGQIEERSSPFENLDRYGGKMSLSYSFYALIETCEKKNEKRVCVASIPNLYCKPGDAAALRNYLTNITKKYKLSRILIPCLRPNFIIERGRSRVVVSGVTGQSYWVKSLNPVYYTEDELKTIRTIRKLVDLVSKKEKKDENREEFVNSSGFFAFANDGLVLNPSANIRSKEIKLLYSDLLHLYDKFADLSADCFNVCSGFSKVASVLKTNRNDFEALPVYRKSALLLDLVVYFNSASQTVDLSLIGGKPSAGASTISAYLLPDFRIIAESPTGFYKKVLWKAE